jgi:hypothetical protein
VLGEGDAVRALGSADFDPAREVVLGSGAALGPAPAAFDGSVRELEGRPDRRVYETRASLPAALVVLEAYRSGWRASVDGKPAEVARANVLFRGVVLPPGEHRVVLEYRPRAVLLGAAASALGLLALAAGLAFVRGSGRPAL